MAGMFDDLIPAQDAGAQAAPASAGMFDDLIPAAKPVQPQTWTQWLLGQPSSPEMLAQWQKDNPAPTMKEALGIPEDMTGEKFKENAAGAARNLVDSATLGLGDKLAARGKAGAVVAPDYGPAQALLRGGNVFGAMSSGNQALAAAPAQPGQYPDYNSAIAGERAKTQAWAEANPGRAVEAQLLGALAPGGLIAKGVGAGLKAANVAPKLLGKMMLGAAGGASFGAASEAGHTDSGNASDYWDAIKKGLTEGPQILGYTIPNYAIGAAAPVVGKAIGAAGQFLAPYFQKAAPGLGKGATGVLQGAAPADLEQRLSMLGPNATLADTGPGMLGVAQGTRTNAVGTPIQAAIDQPLIDRAKGTSGRLASDLESNLGAAQSPIEATKNLQDQRSLLHSYLPQIFAQAPAVDTSGVLSTIGQGLTKAVGPEAAVLAKAKNWLMDEIQVPKGDGTSYPKSAPVSDAERLQNAKLAIDTLIDRGDPGLGVPPGAMSKAQGAIGDVRRQLNQALRDQVPGYSHVMDASSALARKMEAVESGTGALEGGKSAIWPQDLETRLAAMAPGEREAFKSGMRSDIENRVGTQANDLATLKRTLGGEQDWNRAKMGQVFGEQPTQNVADAIGREQTFANTTQKVLGNSETAARLAAARNVEPGTGGGPFSRYPTAYGDIKALVAGLGNKAYEAIRGGYHGEKLNQLGSVITAPGSPYRRALVQALMAGQGAAQRAGQSIGGAISNPALISALLSQGRREP